MFYPHCDFNGNEHADKHADGNVDSDCNGNRHGNSKLYTERRSTGTVGYRNNRTAA